MHIRRVVLCDIFLAMREDDVVALFMSYTKNTPVFFEKHVEKAKNQKHVWEAKKTPKLQPTMASRLGVTNLCPV